MIKKILAPLDGSKLAECVLPYVEEIATKLNAEVVLVTVTNRIQGYWPFEDVSKPSEIDLEPEGICTREEQAEKYLNAIKKRLDEKLIKVTTEVICGKTAQEISFYANDNHCDLIVVSTHGRGGLSKLTHGSTTARILKLTSIPVTVIRPPK